MNRFFIKRKPAFAGLALLLAASLLAGCASQEGTTTPAASGGTTSGTGAGSSAAAVTGAVSGGDITVEYDSVDEDVQWDGAEAAHITLSGDTASSDSDAVNVSGGVITVVRAGTYVVTGTLSGGQLRVDTEDKEAVRIVLNGADITCADSAPIYVLNAKKTVLILADGTENKVTDGAAYAYEEGADEPDAAIFSKADLTINGGGSLTVIANYLDGIVSKDELKILGGNITVNAADDGVRGRDFVALRDGVLTITAQGDGVKSTNDEDGSLGFVLIEGGTLSIDAAKDGIQTQTSLRIVDGDINVKAGGGSENAVAKTNAPGNFAGPRGNNGAATTTEEDTASMKGVKAESDIVIEGGRLALDTADDAIHTNNSISILGGEITIASGDDGIHSDTLLTIGGGSILITKSYEGIESAAIVINGGELRITASDDGINVAGGNDGSSMNGRPGQNSFNANSGYYLEINGGAIAVNAAGDGIDVNGSVTMAGGAVLVSGPTDSGNGALDYDGSFKVSGGLLIAAGSAGMAQAPDGTSTQNTAIITFPSELEAGTQVRIESESGEEIVTFSPAKSIQSFVISSPELVTGETYKVYYGGSSDGTGQDGLITGGSYSGGMEFATFTISSVLTSAGSSAGGAGGGTPSGGGFGGGGRGQRP